MQFKSREGSTGGATDSNAVICTHTKTYNLRQVNTSNSVYIAQPNCEEDDGGDLSFAGLQAIAENNSSLELNLIPLHVNNAKSYIRAALPTYASTGHSQSKELVSRDHLFANIPFSETECDVAFETMACFQLEDPAGCFIPSGQAKVQVWKAILEQATAHSIDLTEPVSLEKSTWIMPATEEWPTALSHAVRDSVSSSDHRNRKVTRTYDEQSCLEFFGLSQLEASVQGKDSISVAVFMAAWADLLPEKWRGKANLELLKGQYFLENDGRDIALAASNDERHGGSSKATPADANSTLGAKRKWHEKFRASKKTA